MFTERFIKVLVQLYDKKSAEIVGYNKDTEIKQVVMMFNPFELSHYREALDEEDNPSETCIYFKSGDSSILSMPISEFEKILNEHQNK